MASRPLRAGVVQQPLSDILPERVCAVEARGIDLLDLDRSAAAAAPDPQKMLRYLIQPQRPCGRRRIGFRARVVQQRSPVFDREVVCRSKSRRWRRFLVDCDAGGEFLHLLNSGEAPAGGRSVMFE